MVWQCNCRGFCHKLALQLASQVCAHGTCSLTSEELKAQSRQYKDKLRTNRILQVRLVIS